MILTYRNHFFFRSNEQYSRPDLFDPSADSDHWKASFSLI